MPPTPALSLVIPARNEEDYLAATLHAVFESARRLEIAGASCEIIVVDNQSTDSTVKIARRFPVTVVTCAGANIAIVRNCGARAAAAELLVFLDADSPASPNSLTRIYETLAGGVYAAGGVRIHPERWTLSAAIFWGLVPVISAWYGVSAGMIFATREAFDAVGGFDESIFAAEDLQLVIALKAWALSHDKAFANLADVHVTTSIRKLQNASLRDFLIFPAYLFDKTAAGRHELCDFWYRSQRA